MTPPDNDVAMELLERALVEEPHFAAGLAHAAWGLEQRLSRSWPNALSHVPQTCRSQRSIALAGGKRHFRLERRCVVPARSSAHGLSCLRPSSALSGRNSTYRLVQICEASSLLGGLACRLVQANTITFLSNWALRDKAKKCPIPGGGAI